ncbi:hypothetical protein BDQ17DRAFT_1001379 [Cyathus striatus]|nr:hypothetical protein BDQ17DRAFT_1001379 [Cyathus striatus]
MANIASKDRSDRREILERLEGLPPLASFIEDEQTPSLGTASLPTPPNNSTFAYHIPYSYIRNDGWYCTALNEEGGVEEREALTTPLQAPGAPLMKDLDSFTEGTGHGSFDSIPAADTNQHGEPILTVDSLSLSLLPPQDELPNIVENWRVQVSASLSPVVRGVVKRRRSPTPDSSRRIRPRSWSLGSAFQQRTRRFARRSSSLPRSLSALSECEPPD